MLTESVFDEFAEFITSQPSLEQLAAYRISATLQQRIRDLLEINRESRLTAEEQHELDEFGYVEHLMRIIKLRALEKLEPA